MSALKQIEILANSFQPEALCALDTQDIVMLWHFLSSFVCRRVLKRKAAPRSKNKKRQHKRLCQLQLTILLPAQPSPIKSHLVTGILSSSSPAGLPEFKDS